MPDEETVVASMNEDVQQAYEEPTEPEQEQTQEPEPTPAPQTQEEEFNVDTSWLDAIGAPQERPQEQPHQHEFQQQYPQGYQPPPPPPPPQQQGYGDDVDAYIAEKARQVYESQIRNYLGPIAMQLQQYQNQTQQHVRSIADTELNRAKFVAKQALQNELSKDKAFRESEAVRNTVQTHLNQWIDTSYRQALDGNPRQLLAMHEPKFFRVLLAAAKEMSDYRPNPSGTGRAVPAVEGVTPPKAEASVELPPDLEEVARKMGPAYRKRLEKEYANNLKTGNIEFWE